MGRSNRSSPLLAPSRGSLLHFILTTLPLLLVLVWFLYEAWRRPYAPIYNLGDDYTDDQWQTALERTGSIVGLMDMLTIFLVIHVLATLFCIYVTVFIPKRRHLIGRYLSEGVSSIGDVIYDRTSRACGGFNDYGYTLYAHPTQKKLIRKRVRVYQQFTRERVTILRLPNRPLSGQAKVDIEIDLSAATRERDSSNRYISIFAICWVVFTLISPIFVYIQMTKVPDEDDEAGLKMLLTVVGLNFPFAFVLNWLRFLMYRNWMVNRGAIIDDDPNARKIDLCCQMDNISEDGSDVIPYSILNEEDMSYQGSLPSYSTGGASGSYSAPNSPNSEQQSKQQHHHHQQKSSGRGGFAKTTTATTEAAPSSSRRKPPNHIVTKTKKKKQNKKRYQQRSEIDNDDLVYV